MPRQNGDTIIEVIIAFAIFSFLAIGVVTTMNMGVAMSQRSLETTLVREQLDNQAVMLRFLRDTNSDVWRSMIDSQVLSADQSPFAPAVDACPDASVLNSKKAFFLYGKDDGTIGLQSINLSSFSPAKTYAKIDFAPQKAYGIWAQVVKTDDNSVNKSYDIYLYACWNTIGGSVPSTINTIVRVYDK